MTTPRPTPPAETEAPALSMNPPWQVPVPVDPAGYFNLEPAMSKRTPADHPEAPLHLEIRNLNDDDMEVICRVASAYKRNQYIPAKIKFTREPGTSYQAPQFIIRWNQDSVRLESRAAQPRYSIAGDNVKVPSIKLDHRNHSAPGSVGILGTTQFSYVMPLGRSVPFIPEELHKRMLMDAARAKFHEEFISLLWQFEEAQRRKICPKFSIGCKCGHHSYLPEGERAAATRAGMMHTCRDLTKMMEYGYALIIL